MAVVRRTGSRWILRLLRRSPVDEGLRSWLSEEIRGIDRGGLAFQAVVRVVWRMRDAARPAVGVEHHEARLAAAVEAAVCRVVSAEARCREGLGEPDPDLGPELTAAVAAECRAVGLDVQAVRPLRIAFAPDPAGAVRCDRHNE